jgi:putative redox protein
VSTQSKESPSGELPAGTVRVAESGAGAFTNTIVNGRHELLADEPQEAGGEDHGPTPYELLLAALGACTSITLRMYADRKEWPLEHVSIDLRHEKIHAEDCAHCTTEKGRIDRIEVEVTLQGPLDDEQRQRLLEIAHKCPVHRTLQNEVDMPTSLKPLEE